MIGCFGRAEVFSFHATKFMNTFEGGAIVTDDDALAAKLRLMLNFGFADYDRVICIGTNGKMSEVCAAMGLTNLDSLEKIITCNRSNHQAYQRRLASIPGLKLLQFDGAQRCNYQYVVVEVGDDAPLSRDELVQVLHAENVIARRYFYPGVHRMEPYRTCFPGAHLHLPVTERVCRQVMLLPTGTAVSEADIDRVAGIIETAVANGPIVRRQIGRLNCKD